MDELPEYKDISDKYRGEEKRTDLVRFICRINKNT